MSITVQDGRQHAAEPGISDLLVAFPDAAQHTLNLHGRQPAVAIASWTMQASNKICSVLHLQVLQAECPRTANQQHRPWPSTIQSIAICSSSHCCTARRFVFEKAKELGVRSIILDGPDRWACQLTHPGCCGCVTYRVHMGATHSHLGMPHAQETLVHISCW